MYNFTLINLYDFDQLRYNFYKNNFDKDLVTQSYFGIKFHELKKKIDNYLLKNNKIPFLSNNEVNLLNSLLGDENYLDLVYHNFKTLDLIEARYQNICKKDIADNLFYIKSNEPVINISPNQ